MIAYALHVYELTYTVMNIFSEYYSDMNKHKNLCI